MARQVTKARKTRRYGKKASEKIARTMHEFKRGKLRSGSGDKVTSRQQAVAIGLSQARRAGYKVPPQRGHASMSLDARVRAHLRSMQPGTEIDARGIARVLGGIDPLEADYALERAQKARLATTSDGRWFGPAGVPSKTSGGAQTGHARKKQLDRDIAEALTKAPPSQIKLKDRQRGHVWLTLRGDRVVGVMGSDPARYMGMTLAQAQHLAQYGGRGHSGHATIKHDRDDARMFGRSARRMEQTRAQTLTNARVEGFAEHQLGAVEEGWEAERAETRHGGFPSDDSSHATRRRARAPRVTPYQIALTPPELQALEFASGRYAWPDMLSAHADENGSISFTESEMWQWADDVDSDARGGHSPFPLASPALAEKLQRFYDARV